MTKNKQMWKLALKEIFSCFYEKLNIYLPLQQSNLKKAENTISLYTSYSTKPEVKNIKSVYSLIDLFSK